jgi:hypothetical protein
MVSATGQDSLQLRLAYLRNRCVHEFHDRRLTAPGLKEASGYWEAAIWACSW